MQNNQVVEKDQPDQPPFEDDGFMVEVESRRNKTSRPGSSVEEVKQFLSCVRKHPKGRMQGFCKACGGSLASLIATVDGCDHHTIIWVDSDPRNQMQP